jgi:hypothetical protein
MSFDAFNPFGDSASTAAVEVDLYTDTYRVSGQVATRFSRVGDIVNQAPAAHLVVERATISEYGAPAATLAAPQVLVSIDEVLFLVVNGVTVTSNPEMRIPKRGVKAQLALPPFRLTGTIHISQGSRPSDGLLNASDRFLPMTEVEIRCATVEGLDRTVAAIAVQRRRAHLLLIADDERPDQLLADVLDEETAQRWFRHRDRDAGSGTPPPGAEASEAG